MIIRYNKFDEDTKDRVRSLESKGHVGYIRYLMMRRFSWADVNTELIRLGLAWASEEDLRVYFDAVLWPVIQEHGLDTYYKSYRDGKKTERLSFHLTFQRSEIDRQKFCICAAAMEIEFFFAAEALRFYGSKANIPINTRTGQPVIAVDGVPEFAEILNHPKRPMIETMLVDGKTPRMIADYLDKTYDVQIEAQSIAFFAKAFFRTRRRDLERTIEDLQEEARKVEESIKLIREADERDMTIGQKSAAIANAKAKAEQLNGNIKRLMGHHSHAAFNAGVLEAAHMREIFADVMLRMHKRFVDMDDRTEDDVVGLLGNLVTSMAKATDKIMALDERIHATVKKTVSEEMLEVIMPTLDRVMEEEKEAYQEYQKQFGGELPPGAREDGTEEVEILGIGED